MCFQSKDATSLVTRRGKRRCAASARVGAIHSVSGTPRRVELSNAGASSSLKHHRICFPLPGGLRRYRDWKLQALTSVITASTTTALHAKTWYRQCETTQVFGLRRERPCRTTYCLASPGCFRLGESHRINHRHPLHLYLHLRQERHPHPPLYGQHCKQPPRAPTTTPWSPGFTSAVTRSYVRSPVATDNRQIGITSQLYQVSSTRKRLNRCTN